MVGQLSQRMVGADFRCPGCRKPWNLHMWDIPAYLAAQHLRSSCRTCYARSNGEGSRANSPVSSSAQSFCPTWGFLKCLAVSPHPNSGYSDSQTAASGDFLEESLLLSSDQSRTQKWGSARSLADTPLSSSCYSYCQRSNSKDPLASLPAASCGCTYHRRSNVVDHLARTPQPSSGQSHLPRSTAAGNWATSSPPRSHGTFPGSSHGDCWATQRNSDQALYLGQKEKKHS